MAQHNQFTAALPIAESLLQTIHDINAPTTPTAVWDAKIRVQNLCDELLRSVLGPKEYTVLLAESCQESQALHFANHYKIADVIGEGQLSCDRLAESINAKPQYLSVVMNCLLGRGYFEEVDGFGSKVYRNNHMSAVLRSDSSVTLTDAIGLTTDEGFKAAGHLTTAASTSNSTSDSKKDVPAVNLAFNLPPNTSIFEWMSQPDNTWRGKRLGRAMQQLHGMANGNVVDDYDWSSLPSPVVDVGGGIGSLEMVLLSQPKNQHLSFTLYDLPKTIENAQKAWQSHEAAKQVSFASGSFMESTLSASGIPLGAPTYLIRHVLHDWSDADVIKILSLVRQALLSPSHNSPQNQDQRRLYLVEMLLFSTSSRFVKTTSMQLLSLNGGITRTEDEMRVLVERAGLEVVSVSRMKAVDCVVEVRVKA